MKYSAFLREVGAYVVLSIFCTLLWNFWSANRLATLGSAMIYSLVSARRNQADWGDGGGKGLVISLRFSISDFIEPPLVCGALWARRCEDHPIQSKSVAFSPESVPVPILYLQWHQTELTEAGGENDGPSFICLVQGSLYCRF